MTRERRRRRKSGGREEQKSSLHTLTDEIHNKGWILFFHLRPNPGFLTSFVKTNRDSVYHDFRIYFLIHLFEKSSYTSYKSLQLNYLGWSIVKKEVILYKMLVFYCVLHHLSIFSPNIEHIYLMFFYYYYFLHKVSKMKIKQLNSYLLPCD